MDENKKTREGLREELNALTNENLDFEASECLQISDLENGIDYVMETLEEHVRETSDIIYYSRAIEYLSENDPSLRESLELASELGYSPEDLDSEKLATILNERNTLDALRDVKDEIEAIIDEFNEIEDEEDD